jgi:hypothetical protein
MKKELTYSRTALHEAVFCHLNDEAQLFAFKITFPANGHDSTPNEGFRLDQLLFLSKKKTKETILYDNVMQGKCDQINGFKITVVILNVKLFAPRKTVPSGLKLTR